MTAFWFSVLTIFSTSAGGLCALALRNRLDRVLGFTAGAVLGVVCFELLPEIFELAAQPGGDGRPALAALVVAFVVLHAAKVRCSAHGHGGDADHHGPRRSAAFTAAALVGHSFFDGIGIGLAFQVSDAVGFAVAVAVIAHDFSDGLNTVGVMLAQRSTVAVARRLLLLNAVAPVFGAASVLLLSVPAHVLTIALGGFAGALLHIGLVDVLPRAWRGRGSAGALGLVALASLGAAFVLGVRQVVS
jgi:ZIP family zinc transporter